MREYLILLKLNPGKLMETLGSLRQLSSNPIDGVDLCYNMNIFGVWDVGVWINAEDNAQVLEFVQKKVKNMAGITDVYTVPTFPHGNEPIKAEDEIKNSKDTEPVKAKA
ncbi:hypothetical protein AC478_00990 [miscellaneous Crenarchaeota group-1 archaeon SG8-32-3]|uniref:Transcription regulator AsnC/Lrp ligand binding domain-containing protein n=1 Tax=miscellaneous Crenarchaeota group-1 archaeon SG8-32-3 TaxID=1685125 RepID=A0A0M0BU87_9ARCH|nr:MAG: hypothetical protein AC478_00990 [miscellaneous Crenarchaeota group-1 archaeon SG8-32-3]